MFSSHQNGRPTNTGRRFVPPPSGWKCPECGEKALIRVKKSHRLHDGVVMPKLDRLECQSCKANFFDPYAMDAIEEFRKRQPLKNHWHKERRGLLRLDYDFVFSNQPTD